MLPGGMGQGIDEREVTGWREEWWVGGEDRADITRMGFNKDIFVDILSSRSSYIYSAETYEVN